MRFLLRTAALCALVSSTLVMVAAVPARHDEASARHLRLLKSAPDSGGVVAAAPTSIELWFSEAPQVRVTTVRLQAGETTVELGKPVADTADGKHITAPVNGALTPGEYRVTWRTMSRDGHVVNGAFTFQYRAAP